MEIVQKGASANIDTFNQLLVTMKWTLAADFDLAAVYENKNGEKGIVYFGTPGKGSLNEFPYIKLGKDAGIGDTGGENKEDMKITKLDDMKYVWIVGWDWGKIEKGLPARFNESDVILSVIDDKGNSHNVNLDTGEMGNVAIIATIDNTSPIGAKLINTSKSGILKGFKKLDSLLAIIND